MRPRSVQLAAVTWAATSWLIASPPALAQRQPLLDLGAAPTAPAPGQGAGALALAAELRKQAGEHSRQSGERERAMAAVRELARALIATGESMGQNGSQRVLLGRTLAAAMPQLDRAIAGLNAGPGEARAALAARDLASAAAAVAKPDADPWRIVRDGLAMLQTQDPTPDTGPNTGPRGWADESAQPDEPLAGQIAAWANAPGVTADTAATLTALDTLAESGMAWPAYRASARHLRAAVRGGASLLNAAPAWIPDPARRIIGQQFSTAAGQLREPDGRDTGVAALRRLARQADLAARIDKLDDNPAVKRIRTALAQTLATVPADPSIQARELEAFDRLLDLALARQALPDERSIIRQARPAWRILGASLKAGEQKLELALLEALTRADAMTDPGVASIIAAQRRAVLDVQALEGLNAAISEPGKGDPAVAERWKRIADRAFKLGQDLAKADTKDAALASLRTMAEEIQAFTTLPGEEALRESVRTARLAAEKNETVPKSVWSTLTGDRESALLSEISDRRGGWLAGWDRAGYAGSAGDVERLRALRALMEVLNDARPITPAPGADSTPEYAALQAWPGWELSDDGFKAIAGGLNTETAEAAAAIVAGDAGKCTKLVDALRTDRSAALLAGRLAKEAAARGFKADPLLEVGSGGPVAGVSWMGAHADAIADVCRYADEVATARKLGNKDGADKLLKFVNARAGETLDAITQSEPRP